MFATFRLGFEALELDLLGLSSREECFFFDVDLVSLVAIVIKKVGALLSADNTKCIQDNFYSVK